MYFSSNCIAIKTFFAKLRLATHVARKPKRKPSKALIMAISSSFELFSFFPKILVRFVNVSASNLITVGLEMTFVLAATIRGVLLADLTVMHSVNDMINIKNRNPLFIIIFVAYLPTYLLS